MTSKERVRCALKHRPYDGLAIDFGAMRSTGINAMAYNTLMKHLGFNKHAIVYDIFQQLALPDIEVVNHMGGDVMQVHRLCPAFDISIKSWKESCLQDGSMATVPLDFNPVPNGKNGLDLLDKDGQPLARMPEGGLYYDPVQHRFSHIETEAEAASLTFQTVTDEDLDFIEQQCQKLHSETDKAILLCFGGSIYERGQLDFGYEKFFMDLALNPEMLHAYFTKISDAYLIDLEKILDRVGKFIDVIQFGDDLGTQVSIQTSRDMYLEMIMPYHQKQYKFVRQNYPDVHVFLHSCGAISELIPDLIEAGVQVLNPVQISAKGMDPATLKREFGKDIVFWGGGADMQTFVPNNNEEAIKKHVAGLIDIFNSDNTGFVFTQVHNIQYGVDPQKICAIYDTAKSYAKR